MRRESFGELQQTHARLCHELQVQRDALTKVLRETYGRDVSSQDLEAHRLATIALEEVKRRLSAISLKMAARH
jgi:hypothetical protein